MFIIFPNHFYFSIVSPFLASTFSLHLKCSLCLIVSKFSFRLFASSLHFFLLDISRFQIYFFSISASAPLFFYFANLFSVKVFVLSLILSIFSFPHVFFLLYISLCAMSSLFSYFLLFSSSPHSFQVKMLILFLILCPHLYKFLR